MTWHRKLRLNPCEPRALSNVQKWAYDFVTSYQTSYDGQKLSTSQSSVAAKTLLKHIKPDINKLSSFCCKLAADLFPILTSANSVYSPRLSPSVLHSCLRQMS
jgi:hypothetical protein